MYPSYSGGVSGMFASPSSFYSAFSAGDLAVLSPLRATSFGDMSLYNGPPVAHTAGPHEPLSPSVSVAHSLGSSSLSNASPLQPSSGGSVSEASPVPVPVSFVPTFSGGAIQSHIISHGSFSFEIPFASEHSEGYGGMESQPGRAPLPTASPLPVHATSAFAPPPPPLPHAASVPTLPSVAAAAPPSRTVRAKSSAGSGQRKRSRADAASPVAASTILSPGSEPGAATPVDRDELKRVKHRNIDATRRARESAAIMRLNSLLEPTADSSSPPSRDKVSILESAASRLTELEADMERLRRELSEERERSQQLALTAQRAEQQARALLLIQNTSNDTDTDTDSDSGKAMTPTNDGSFTPAALSYVKQLELRSTLYDSVFHSNTWMLLILDVQTGKCIDVNNLFLTISGWQREDVIGRNFCGVTEAQLEGECQQSMADNLTACTLGDSANGGRESQFTGDKAEHWRRDHNRAELVALYSGRKSVVHCTFRCMIATKQMVDARCVCYLGGTEAARHLIIQAHEDRVVLADDQSVPSAFQDIAVDGCQAHQQ